MAEEKYNFSSVEDPWAYFYDVNNDTDSERYQAWLNAVMQNNMSEEEPVQPIQPRIRTRTLEQHMAIAIFYYYRPIMIFLGLIGNTTTWLILLRSRLRSLSSSHYLAAIVIVDSLYLVAILMPWLDAMGINCYHRAGWCQFVTFVHKAAQFFIPWYLTAFTVERYICICWPAEAPKMCTKSRARVVIIGILCVAVAVFINISITYGLWSYNGKLKCSQPGMFREDFAILSIMDRYINMLLPYLTILILTILIIYNTCKAYKQRLLSDNPAQIRRVTIVFLSTMLICQLPAETYIFVTKGVCPLLKIHPMNCSFPAYVVTPLQYLHHTSLCIHFILFAASYPMFAHTCKTPFLWLNEKFMMKFRKAPEGDINLRNVRFHAVQEETNVAHV